MKFPKKSYLRRATVAEIAQPAQSEQSDSAEQQAEQPADVQNVNTESDGE